MQQTFTEARLCQMHLMILFDRIIDFLNKSSAVDLISLDLYSVFDVVTRLVKLQKTGISAGNVWRTMESIFWESLGCSGDPGIPLGLVGQIDCIYNSNFPGTKKTL